MARFTFKLPDIGEGISEAEIVAWHVAVGDRVEEDQQLADMMTDKATVEMESPVSGVVVELAGEVGDMVPIGSTLAVIEVAGEDGVEAETQVEDRIDAETPDAETVEAVQPSPLQGRGLGEGESVSPRRRACSNVPLSPALSPEGEREIAQPLWNGHLAVCASPSFSPPC